VNNDFLEFTDLTLINGNGDLEQYIATLIKNPPSVLTLEG
jgi:hypothetical protein